MRSSRGFGYLSVTGTQQKSILGLSVFSFGLYHLKACLVGVQIWKHRAYCCTSWLRALGGAASGVSSPQASEVGMRCRQGTQCVVASSHPRSGSILQKVDLCMVSCQRKRCILAWQLYTLSLSGCTSHKIFPVPVSSWSQRWKRTPVSTSQAQVMECSSLPIGSFFHLSNFSRGSIGNIEWGLRWATRGMLRRKDAFSARERMPRSGRLDEDRRVGVGERGNRRVFGVKLWRTGPMASQFNFQVRWGWTSLFLIYSCISRVPSFLDSGVIAPQFLTRPGAALLGQSER